MIGKRLAAWTIPYPIRCVNDTFLPLAASWELSALRRASRVVAWMSRKEVAVGTVSDSVMFATNRAAGPAMGTAFAGTACAVSGAPCAGRLGVAALAGVRLTADGARSTGITGSYASF